MCEQIISMSDICIRFKNQIQRKIIKVYKNISGQEYVIWGTGAYGRWLLSLFKDIGIAERVRCFCDSFHNDNNKDLCETLPIFSPKKCFELYKDATYIIASDFLSDILEQYGGEIPNIYVPDLDTRLLQKQLIYFKTAPDPQRTVAFNYTWFPIYAEAQKSGKLFQYLDYILPLLEDQKSKDILKNRVNTFLTGDISYLDNIEIDPNEYFSDDYYHIGENEVFFDCGAYIGDSIKSFIEYTKGRYSKIVAFEPDSINLKKISKYLEQEKPSNVQVISAATGKHDGYISFVSSGTGASKTVSDRCCSPKITTVKLIKLDDLIDYHPTLIKMDIEGAELDALAGAAGIIKKYKPKLAISIYHLPFDFYNIPNFIKSLVPEYKFKIRQSEKGVYDTDLYAYIS